MAAIGAIGRPWAKPSPGGRLFNHNGTTIDIFSRGDHAFAGATLQRFRPVVPVRCLGDRGLSRCP